MNASLTIPPIRENVCNYTQKKKHQFMHKPQNR